MQSLSHSSSLFFRFYLFVFSQLSPRFHFRNIFAFLSLFYLSATDECQRTSARELKCMQWPWNLHGSRKICSSQLAYGKNFSICNMVCMGRGCVHLSSNTASTRAGKVGWDSRSAHFRTMMMAGGAEACGRQWRWQLKRGGRISSAPKLASINHRVKFQRRQSRSPCQQWRNEWEKKQENVQVIRVECIAIYSVFKRKTRLSHVACRRHRLTNANRQRVI